MGDIVAGAGSDVCAPTNQSRPGDSGGGALKRHVGDNRRGL